MSVIDLRSIHIHFEEEFTLFLKVNVDWSEIDLSWIDLKFEWPLHESFSADVIC